MIRLQFSEGSTFCLQHTVSGTGRFTGVPLGYATYKYSSGGIQFDVRADNVGTYGNEQKIELIAATGVTPNTTARYSAQRKTTTVLLARSSGSITATAAQVCDAINALRDSGAGVLQAGVRAAGTIPAALAAQSLAGGLDPDVTAGRAYPKLTAADTPAGLFYFDQRRAWRILSVGGEVSGDSTVAGVIVPINRALIPDATPTSPLFSSALSGSPRRLTSANIDVPLMPGQALSITASGSVTGSIWVVATPLR